MRTSFDPDASLRLPTARELVIPVFRYRTAVLVTMGLVLAATAAVILLTPRRYEAEMKILVKRERMDPIMSPDAQGPSVPRPEVSESEVLSEVELLQSRDLLEKVVVATGLNRWRESSKETAAAATARATRALQEGLTVQPLRRSAMIRVAYRSRNPQLAARVLDELARRYLEKHLSVHRPAGAHDFFTEQAARSAAQLRQAQARLVEFTDREQVVSAEDQKASALRTLSDFEARLAQVEAEIADATRRTTAIDAKMRDTPDRQVTQIRNSENVELVRGFKSRILELEIKREEMLQKFTPAYPPVVQLEHELRQLREAVAAAEQAPLRDETTDQNPTFQWLRNEAARVHTERTALLARADAIRRTIADYRERARRLEEQGIREQQLVREVKAAEENYLLYQRKREEARISDALDFTRIANVAIAEPPTVPQTPLSSRRRLMAAAGLLLALLAGLGVAFVLHALNPFFRTPDDVLRVLDVPVLATLPAASVVAEDA